MRPGLRPRPRKYDLIVVTCLEPHFRTSTSTYIVARMLADVD